jgi:hypothetical protein
MQGRKMKFILPPPEKRIFALRALKTVAMATGTIHENQAKLLHIAIDVLKVETAIEDLEVIDAETLSAQFENQELREALIQRLIIMTTLDGEVTDAEMKVVEEYAAAMDVHDRIVKDMRLLVQGHYRLMAFDLGRRSFMPKQIKRIWNEEGLKGIWKIARVPLGVTDEEATTRFKALGDLDENTVGYGLYRQFTDNGFPMPGEKAGIPDNMMFHDIGHVIGGYGTDPEGELLVAGFQAGYMGEDGMIMFMMITLLFQLGIEPLAELRGVPATKHALDIETYSKAFLRGKSLNQNLMQWDPWPHMERPLAEVRAELGLAEDPA